MAFIRRKSVEQIVKPITKIVTQLNDHAAVNAADAEREQAEAVRRSTLAAAHNAEANKAIAAAANISKLIG